MAEDHPQNNSRIYDQEQPDPVEAVPSRPVLTGIDGGLSEQGIIESYRKPLHPQVEEDGSAGLSVLPGGAEEVARRAGIFTRISEMPDGKRATLVAGAGLAVLTLALGPGAFFGGDDHGNGILKAEQERARAAMQYTGDVPLDPVPYTFKTSDGVDAAIRASNPNLNLAQYPEVHEALKERIEKQVGSVPQVGEQVRARVVPLNEQTGQPLAVRSEDGQIETAPTPPVQP